MEMAIDPLWWPAPEATRALICYPIWRGCQGIARSPSSILSSMRLQTCGPEHRPLDIGRPKVLAQAEKLRRIRPGFGHAGLDMIALQQRIEDVPRGLLKCDLIVSCLDSKAARQHVNEIAWRLKRPGSTAVCWAVKTWCA